MKQHEHKRKQKETNRKGNKRNEHNRKRKERNTKETQRKENKRKTRTEHAITREHNRNIVQRNRK